MEGVPLEIVVWIHDTFDYYFEIIWIYDTFDYYFEIKVYFTKYLKESCW